MIADFDFFWLGGRGQLMDMLRAVINYYQQFLKSYLLLMIEWV